MNAEDDIEKRPALTRKPGKILVTMGLRGSSATGVMTVGTPALRAVAVVPEPPWWTVHAHRGKSHSWGAFAAKKMFLSA